jgi:hypothetical protein
MACGILTRGCLMTGMRLALTDMKLKGRQVIEWMRRKGSDSEELRFLRGEMRRGAVLELEVFDGPDPKKQFDQAKVADAVEQELFTLV